jgi:hypothetical protein
MTADRAAKKARDIREALAPESCGECLAIATMADGLVQMARQGFGAPMAEHLLAQAAAALGVAVDPVDEP